MEHKTKIIAENGKQEMLISREFSLPVELLFKAYTEPELIGKWMGAKITTLESKNGGNYQFETSDPQGKIMFQARGVIHTVIPDQKIIRTFEMENPGFEAQLEFLNFEKLRDQTSMLTIHTIFKSVELRDRLLELPFAFGLNMAHDRLESILKKYI